MEKSILYFLLLFLLSSCADTSNEESRPQHTNVVLILTDDQGYGDVGIHGNDSIHTPMMDLLAKEGIRMDNFYVSPVCAPTRASLLTGRYHYRTGTTWVTRNGEAMRSEEVTLAEVFQANGYKTGAFGKWHNGAHYPQHPNGQGFETFTGLCGGHWNRYINPELEHNGQIIQPKGYITDILTDSAMAFVERHHDEPFFVYLPYNTPHTPYIAPDDLYKKYKKQGLSDKVASSYGMVESIDQNMGRLVSQLKELNLIENTLIIFITDNGPNYDRYNAGMKGRKGWVNDGGVRVPCFIYQEGHVEGGRKINQLAAHIDLLPTLVEYLKLKSVETLPLDGQSFAQLLTAEQERLPDRQFFTFHVSLDPYRGAVRTQDYRLTVSGENDYQLTRLLQDPGEQKDLKDSMPEMAERLYNDYIEAYADVTKGIEDWLPIPVGYKEAPLVSLPAHEGFFTGGITYEASDWGWCNDWFVNWTSLQDTMYWKVDVNEATRYKVSLQYTCPEENIGSNIIVQHQYQMIESEIKEAFAGAIIPNYEQVARVVEAEDHTWAKMKIGELDLASGKQRIALYAKDIANGPVATVKSLILEKVD
jgi:arylsulfatase A